MKLFPYGHITHPEWRMAVALVVAQIRGRMAQGDYARTPALGLVYFSDHFGRHAEALLEALQDEFPCVSDWAGSVGVGVMASHAEYLGDPTLSVMLLDLPASTYRIFSGIAPLPVAAPGVDFSAHSALVHADGGLPDLGELLRELAERTSAHQLMGGTSSGIVAPLQVAWSKSQAPAHCGVFQGGLSGVAFDADAGVVMGFTQGCQPVSERMRITAQHDNVVLALDGRPALDVLEDVMLVSLEANPELATRKMRHIQIALESAGQPAPIHADQIAAGAHVRLLAGVDVARRGIVLSESALSQKYLTFCQRNLSAARADLLRMCSELRESLSPQGTVGVLADADIDASLLQPHALSLAQQGERAIVGAVYVSCVGRGGPYFGGDHAELALLHRVLGDVPLIGFFSNAEIAGQQLHRYSGALLVFTQAV